MWKGRGGLTEYDRLKRIRYKDIEFGLVQKRQLG